MGVCNPLRFGIIGCGKIARKHIAVLAELKGAEVSAVCDIDSRRAEGTAHKIGATVYPDAEALLSDDTVDVVDILAPSDLHAEIGIAAARSGKHVVVEKPLAMSLSEADRLIDECGRHGVKLFEIKQNRCNVPVRKLREALENGRFGRLVLGTVRVRWCRTQVYYDQASWRGTRKQDGGVLTNQANHHVDLLQWMMGPVKSVMAKADTFLCDIEVANTAVALLRFMNGALGIIEATMATRPTDLEGSLSILGERGSVIIGGYAANELATWKFDTPLPGDETIFERFGKNPEGDFAYAHRQIFSNILGSLKGAGKGLIDGIEAKKSLELIHALNESARTGQEVFLSPPYYTNVSWL